MQRPSDPEVFHPFRVTRLQDVLCLTSTEPAIKTVAGFTPTKWCWSIYVFLFTPVKMLLAVNVHRAALPEGAIAWNPAFKL